MNYSTLNEVMEQMKLQVEIDALSVYQALEQVQDGRHKRGVRYSVALIFTLKRHAPIGAPLRMRLYMASEYSAGESGGDDDASGDCENGSYAAIPKTCPNE